MTYQLNNIYPLVRLPGSTVIKNLPTSAGDMGLIPGIGISPREKKAVHSNILAWEIPWTEEPGGLQSTELNMT